MPLFVLAAPVLAVEDVRYVELLAWVEPLYDGGLAESRDNIPLHDRQVRLEDGTVTRYTDIAYRLDSRALAYCRLGRKDEAMADLDAALAQDRGRRRACFCAF